MRRTLIHAVALITALLSLFSVPASAAVDKEKVTIAVGGKGLFYYLPLSIAEQLGYFKQEGLNVEIVDFAGGAKALQAVVGGSADVVSGAYEHTIKMQEKKQYFTAFVQQSRAPQIVLGVSTRSMPNFKTVSDLKGKKIGVTAPGSSTNMVASFVLDAAGVNPSEVSFIGVGAGAGAVAALRSGQIDAISNLDPVISTLEKDGSIKVVVDTRKLDATRKVFGGDMPAASLYAPEDFIKKYPKTTQALTNAIVRANRWLAKATPDEVLKAVPASYHLGDPDLYKQTFLNIREALSPDGSISESGTQTALKALAAYEDKFDAKAVDLKRTYTNSFVSKVPRQ
ncbi:MAG: ABC transporter substrate-binding protein [Betaproteobacteria bacterium]|nr:ABC transporter substrate-binding protein [Betaproteobacteria bacterium]NBT75423.1 ABC transporter substrate-binding protein [Betaproteobacteria bacterium]NBY14231.1 ABC transporter substrate-binding protein [Betaproteobacteria bacterium]NCA16349.1 ABC transporter substrate-binding protein [Betaproteobacteria bacterium]NDF03578.1 ABC transporter substrate-binding protein [Betaproteobacteria bacterium]